MYTPTPRGRGPYRTNQRGNMFKHANVFFPNEKVRVISDGKVASATEGRILEVDAAENQALVDFGGDHRQWIELSRLDKA